MVFKIFDKAGFLTGPDVKPSVNKELAQELHKAVIKKIKKEEPI